MKAKLILAAVAMFATGCDTTTPADTAPASIERREYYSAPVETTPRYVAPMDTTPRYAAPMDTTPRPTNTSPSSEGTMTYPSYPAPVKSYTPPAPRR